MADDLIKRSDAIDLLLRLRDKAGNEDMAFALNFAAKESFPLIEAQKAALIRQERWVGSSPFTDTFVCSGCDWNIPCADFATDFCPGCGATMINAQEVREQSS